MNVLLFDIDGTLIQSGGAGGAALRHAFCELFGVEEAAEVPFSGRTDKGIVSEMMACHELELHDHHWPDLQSRYLEHLARYLPEKEGSVLEGVTFILERLAGREDIALGLLTGNLREGARVKLQHFGLFDYFEFGGFGDHHVHRNDVAREAKQAADDHLSGLAAGDKLWVIGDTPLDIECGRAIEANVIAVTTGLHDQEELAAARPDFLVDRLADSPLADM